MIRKRVLEEKNRWIKTRGESWLRFKEREAFQLWSLRKKRSQFKSIVSPKIVLSFTVLFVGIWTLFSLLCFSHLSSVDHPHGGGRGKSKSNMVSLPFHLFVFYDFLSLSNLLSYSSVVLLNLPSQLDPDHSFFASLLYLYPQHPRSIYGHIAKGARTRKPGTKNGNRMVIRERPRRNGKRAGKA